LPIFLFFVFFSEVAASFNHPVGAGEERCWHIKADPLRPFSMSGIAAGVVRHARLCRGRNRHFAGLAGQ